MTQTIDERLILAQPEGPDFFRDAVATYGRDGALDICEGIMSSMLDAQRALPLRMPVRTLGLKVARVQNQDEAIVYPVLGLATASQRRMDLLFDPRANVSQVLGQLPEVIWHEEGHIAHFQYNPDMFRLPGNLWTYTIREGIADHCAYSRNANYSPKDVFGYDDDLIRAIDHSLVDILYDPGEGQEERHYDFVQGDENLPSRGYVVGHWVVALMAESRGLTIEQLMQVSLAEWRDFAENYL